MGNDRCKREGAMQYPRTKIKRGRIKPDVLCRFFFFLASSYSTWHRERKVVCIRKGILNTPYVFLFLNYATSSGILK